ncbi:MAG: PEP/pyruvate-binding domain-containing protein [Pseudomonadota bacterium]
MKPKDARISATDTGFSANFKIYHELMANKVRQILLVSSPYDAFILEEDGSLATRIITEYSGLNLSHPPRVTRIASARRALEIIGEMTVDLVLTMPHLDDMDAFSFGAAVKRLRPELPVILLAHSTRGIFPVPPGKHRRGIDRMAIWSGNSDLLLALVKNVEDRMNVARDCRRAQVRVLLLVEDNPVYQSLLLPLVYKEVVRQTQGILMEGLNEDHRLLKMRARPKILLAETYDEAVAAYEQYKDYMFGVISDTRMPRGGAMNPDAGWELLTRVRAEIPDLPLLLLSANPENAGRAAAVPAVFLDKNAPHLLAEIHAFFLSHLGFGDFVFRLPDGTETARAANLRELQERIAEVPEASLLYHARRNHFSNWIMGRSEIALASVFRTVHVEAFENIAGMRRYLIDNIRALRRLRQKGVVAQFKGAHYDPEVMDFVRIGSGSLGGKARSLAFMSAMLQESAELHEAYPTVDIQVPRTLVICTDGFEAFLEYNQMGDLAAAEDLDNREVTRRFLAADMPPPLLEQLTAFSRQVTFPLSVRSSSLLEDAQFQPYAGLYETYMIPNNAPDPALRLSQLVDAVKLVYASTFYENPRAYSRHIATQPQEEAMAVIIQELAGSRYGKYFYPTFAGVAQSHNYYPVAPMTADDGIALVALGMGRTVVQGERCLRFSPRHPGVMPQFSSVDDMLENAQRYFYALKIEDCPEALNYLTNANLEKRDIDDAAGEYPVNTLASTYIIDEHRIRDSFTGKGPTVITFASVLKYRRFPLANLLADLLALGRKGMGCPVEMEFAVDLAPEGSDRKDAFYFLQMRPMAAGGDVFEVDILAEELQTAVCNSSSALGNGRLETIRDVVYVRPDTFEAAATAQMAEAVGRINADLSAQHRPYLLVGPGRWGSADRWLGIPVQWHQISAVGAIVEIRNQLLHADPSQGSHFFQNITALGIPYITITEGADGCFDYQWLDAHPAAAESQYIRHIRLDAPLVIKINGRTGQGVILPGESPA